MIKAVVMQIWDGVNLYRVTLWMTVIVDNFKKMIVKIKVDKRANLKGVEVMLKQEYINIIKQELDLIEQYDDTCKVVVLSNDKIVVTIRDNNSDWYNFKEGDNLICAESIKSFNKWSQCYYKNMYPSDEYELKELISHLKEIDKPIHVELASRCYQLFGDDIGFVMEVIDITRNEKVVISN